MGGGWSRERGRGVEAAPRVGIATPYMLRKGLTTLSRSIEWALDGSAEVFPIRKLARLDRDFARVRATRIDDDLRHPRVVRRGRSFRHWVRGLDVLVAVERAMPRLCGHCREQGVRSVIVALPDWLPAERDERVAGLAAADACVVYSDAAARALEADGLSNVVSLPLAVDWPVEAPRPVGERVVCYFNVGAAGPLDRRSVPMVLETFRELLPRHADLELVVKLIPRAQRWLGELEPVGPRMTIVDREVPLAEMMALQRAADLTLFPSRFEGVGYPVLESLHAGVPVLATDAPPMNEMVRDGENGLLVRAQEAGRFGAQAVWDLDRAHFRAQIERCLADRALLSRLKAAAGKGRSEAAEALRAGWTSLIERLMSGSA